MAGRTANRWPLAALALSSRPVGKRLAIGGALAAASGVLLTVSFAPYDLWWLIWVAMVPMLVAQHRILPPAWSALGPAIGMGGFMAGYFGGIFPASAAWYMKALPLLVGVLVFLGSRGGRAARDRVGYAGWPLAAGAAWVALDLARSFAPMLGTWGFFGYALYRQTWLLQPVRFAGIFGLDLLIVVVNHAVAMAVISLLDARGVGDAQVPVVPRHAALWCGGALAALAGWCALGASPRPEGERTVRVAVLQPGLRKGDAGATPQARTGVMLDRLSAQTREAALRGARLVVWPEGALEVDPAVAYPGELRELARTTAASVVVGYVIRSPAGKRNEVVTVEPGGAFVGRFGKDHPVGFTGETSLTRGAYPTVDEPFGRMGSIICYDMDFTDTARRLARQGAKIIAVPSADWPTIATKHYTHSVFRALETGAVVAKSEYAFDSAIVDGYGHIAASAVMPAGGAAVLVADVPLRAGEPLAARLGDWVGWLCAAGLTARALWRRRGRAPRAASLRSPSEALRG
jgi:apolipoprotein N-acyltransferase